jgi:phage-related protein
MSPDQKPLAWLGGVVRTPPFSREARLEVGFLLRQLQSGQIPPMPHSRPMPSIGVRCHELRVQDKNVTWRLIYRIEEDCVLILEVFDKKTAKTPKSVIDTCKQRIKAYGES